MMKARVAFIGVLLILSMPPVFAETIEDPLEWPRLYISNGDKMLMHQPQVQSWEDHEHMMLMAAVKVTPKGEKEGVYGAIHVEASTKTDLEARVVVFKNMRLLLITFPGVDGQTTRRCEKIVKNTLKFKKQVDVSLDLVIAALERSEQQQPTVAVNLAPPPIYYSEQPAILVIFLGEPKFETEKSSGLLYAVNTNWDIFLDTSAATYYLLNRDHWLETKNPLKGPWRPAPAPPYDLYKLPDEPNWEAVNQQLPGKKATAAPAVFTSLEPAELIATDGPPTFIPIPDTSILYATNTDSDLFLHSADGNYYFLTAGRWFRAKNPVGPWTMASIDLPEDFMDIPIDHPKSHVLASVPGAPEADAAVLLASIPQKASVDRKTTTVTVVYEGDPDFVLIEGTTVYYAVNSPQSVFKVGHKYYACHQGVWFISSSPLGPWKVCTKIPDAIYTIPATHPKHNVTYVYVYDSTPDTVVVGYSSGYTGAYVATTGILMFGLGYAIAHDHYHHYHYHPHYYAYGGGARYDYYHGGYYRSAHAYGPYGGAGRAAGYNPATGTYARGAHRYGPGGGAFARGAYNPYTDRYAARAGSRTPHGSRGRTVVGEGDDWARGGHRSNARGAVAGVETSKGGKAVGGYNRWTGQSGFAAKTKDGDVYAGRNGNVYKRDDDGDWKKRAGGSWKTVENPGKQVNRDYKSRQTGQRRGAQYQQRTRSRSRSAGRPRRR